MFKPTDLIGQTVELRGLRAIDEDSVVEAHGTYRVIDYEPAEPDVGILSDGLILDNAKGVIISVDPYELLEHIDPIAHQRRIETEQRWGEEEEAMRLAEEGLRGA